MNIHDRTIAPPKVTTGPLPSSRKAYAKPETAPELRVPVREIMLTEAAAEPPVPVYDTTGPYTDPAVAIDVEKGLARTRTEWVRERGGVEEYQGRPIQPVDNGNVSGKHLARNYPTVHRPLRAAPTLPSPASGGGIGRGQAGREQASASGSAHPLTQLEWARAGVITKEMIYVAERENLGRKQMLERAEAAREDGESFGAAVPRLCTPDGGRSE